MCSKHTNSFDLDPGKRQQHEGFFGDENEDEDDLLISQAYDLVMVNVNRSCEPLVTSDLTCNNKKDEEDLITVQDLLDCSVASCYNENIPDFDDDILDDINASSFVIKPLKKIALSVAMNYANRTDNDLTDSCTIATIILMEVFDKAMKTVKLVKRWKKPNPASWKVNVAKKRRAEGSPYVIKNKIRPAKTPKQVDCSKCQQGCCNKISEELRLGLCRKYWRLDYAGQKNFLLANIEVNKTKTMTLERKRETKRNYSTQCFFKLNGTKTKVCQKFFCATLCISRSVIDNAVKNRDSFGQFTQESDPRGRCESVNKTPPEKVEEVRNHIRSFPSMESHYIRKDSKRQYLDCKLSVAKMYQLYKQECEKQKSKPVSEITYRRIFGTDFNMGFFKPKKDQCLICTRYAREDARNKEKLDEEYKEHIARKEACNIEKDKDKERAGKENEFVSVSFDLQAILQIPSGDVGLLYYTRKLTIYNLTIYESALPNDAYCFTWSEINGKKGSCEIGTILYYYLTKCVPRRVTEISLFSDTCGGQNRNKNVAALLLWAVQKIENITMIEQKFLESGHSYMEADSMHSSIESAQKNTSIYSMSDWINIFKKARSKKDYKKDNKKVVKKPYQVKEFKFFEFKDLEDLADKTLINTVKDTEGKKVKWLKIKRLRYLKGQTKLYYNYDMFETFSIIDVTTKSTKKNDNDNKGCETAKIDEKQKGHNYNTRNKKKQQDNSSSVAPETSNASVTPDKESYFPENLQQKYQTSLEISVAKKKDLIKLCEKGVIPEELHAWYYGVKADNTCEDRVPDCTISDEDPLDEDVLDCTISDEDPLDEDVLDCTISDEHSVDEGVV